MQGMDWSRVRALVTGGSAGIGLAIARQIRERGGRVVLNGRNHERLDTAAQELQCDSIAADVGEVAQAQRLVAESVTKLGGLDLLVNNAAWGERMGIDEIDEAVFEAMWRTNVLGATVVTREAVPHLKESSRQIPQAAIVNIASTAGLRGYATGSAYVSTKFALRGLTQCWQAELRPHDIRVLLVNPSEVQTGFGGADPATRNNPHKLFADDIAHAVVANLDMHPRGYIPEVTIHATNPWKEA